jgi:hypothetical protein
MVNERPTCLPNRSRLPLSAFGCRFLAVSCRLSANQLNHSASSFRFCSSPFHSAREPRAESRRLFAKGNDGPTGPTITASGVIDTSRRSWNRFPTVRGGNLPPMVRVPRRGRAVSKARGRSLNLCMRETVSCRNRIGGRRLPAATRERSFQQSTLAQVVAQFQQEKIRMQEAGCGERGSDCARPNLGVDGAFRTQHQSQT